MGNTSKEEDIKAIIAQTINELHSTNAVQIQKPKTLQGWIYVILGLVGVISFVGGGIIYLNDIAKHAEAPHHAGVEALVQKFTDAQAAHEEDRDMHRTEAELQLKIMKETAPLKTDIHDIKMDVREIQRSVDILVEDNRRRRE
jgi:hypothetical protein